MCFEFSVFDCIDSETANVMGVSFLLSVLYPFLMEGKVLMFVVGCDIDFILFYLFIYLSMDVPVSSRVL